MGVPVEDGFYQGERGLGLLPWLHAGLGWGPRSSLP